MTEGVVRNGLWYPDDRDWVEVTGPGVPDAVKDCKAGEWTWLGSDERQARAFYGKNPSNYAAKDLGDYAFGPHDRCAVLDLRPKPQPRKDNGPSADTQARDWCHQQWTETERELRKANAYIRELEAEVERLKGKCDELLKENDALEDKITHMLGQFWP